MVDGQRRLGLGLWCVTMAMLVGCAGGDGDPGNAPPPNDLGYETYWSGDMEIDTVWTRDMCPVRVGYALKIGANDSPATLTIEPGCIVYLDGSSIDVKVSGSIQAIGTPEEPIVFAGWENGMWGGIQLDGPPAQESRFENVVIQGARDALDVFRASPVLIDTTVAGSLSNSILMDTAATFGAESARVTIEGGGRYGLVIGLAELGTIPPDSDFSGNALGGVTVKGGTIDASMTWRGVNAEFHVGDSVFVAGENSPVLTIGAGATIVMPPETRIDIGYSGRLEVLGTESAPVTLKPQPDASWDGLWVHADSSVEHAVIQGGQSACVSAFDAVITMRDVVVDCEFTGISMGGNSSFGVGSTALTIPSSSRAVWLGPPAVKTLPKQDSTYGGASSRVLVSNALGASDTIVESGTWRALDTPYSIGSDVEVGGTAAPTLSIEPGTTLEFWGSGIQVRNGALVSVGTALEPIVFTGSPHEKGAWDGLTFHDTSFGLGSTLEHVVIEEGGGGSSFGNLALTQTDTIVRNATIRRGLEFGITMTCPLVGGPTIENITYGTGADSNDRGDLDSPGC